LSHRLFHHTPSTDIYTLSLHDALPISLAACDGAILVVDASQGVEAQTIANAHQAMEHHLKIVPVINKIDLQQANPELVREEIERSEEHTSELQSRGHLVCRLLLEKKKK